jgi:catechol 2,3-dioxygenase-like lactoylglutathione lyase family enzyme
MNTPSADTTVNRDHPFASWKVDHAAIRVPDFDTAIAWYTEVSMGLRVAFFADPWANLFELTELLGARW